MESHELAKKLLELPCMPVAIHSNGNTYISELDSLTHGVLYISKLKTYGKDHILIGNPDKLDLNSPNWYIEKHF